jgi:putative hydrolase of the HAD superfamily
MASRSRTLSAVLFDLDDTLLDGYAAWETGLTQLLRRCPGADPVAARSAWSEANEEYFPRYLSGELTFDEHRTARMRRWGERIGVVIPDGAELDWFGTYRLGYEAGWCTFADVGPCLSAIDGRKLAIITNGDSVQQHRKVEALGLTSVFDVVIASGDIGIAKPDARIFTQAAELLGVSPSQCAYIGDKRDTDAEAATAAGMTGIWLDRAKRAAPDDGARDDGARDDGAPDDGAPAGSVLRIASLAELSALLGPGIVG